MMGRRQMFFAFVFGTSLIIVLLANWGYRAAFIELRESLDTHLGRELTGLAQALAESIDPADAALIVGDSFRPEVYLAIHDLLRQFREGNQLVSVHILDTLWNDPYADSPDTLSRAVYALLDREGQWAVMSGLTWTSPTYAWGDTYYRSAAAPVTMRGTGTTVAIVRLEADASYFGALATLDRLAWWIHVSSALLALALMAIFAWYVRKIRNWEHRLTHSEKLIGLGRLAATIAHEIRNPLGIIKATAQRLEKVEDPQKRSELARFIPEEADRLNRILTGYLSVASPSERPPVAVDVGGAIAGWLESLEKESAGMERHCRIEIQATVPVLADPDAPRQVLANLVRNAWDASPAGSVVEVRWEPAGPSRGRLVVADRGPGVPRRQRERVFDPFYTTKAKGSGLGLHAVRMMVERDRGRVWVEENPGGGARFVVEWPLATRRESPGGNH